MNKVILLLNTCLYIALVIVSGKVFAAYYPEPSIPDYETITMPCQSKSQSISHYYIKHHHKHTVLSQQRNHYSIAKYYVYPSILGGWWVPSQNDCCSRWVKARQIKSSSWFAEEPYNEKASYRSTQDEIDYVMDMRTSDDVLEPS